MQRARLKSIIVVILFALFAQLAAEPMISLESSFHDKLRTTVAPPVTERDSTDIANQLDQTASYNLGLKHGENTTCDSKYYFYGVAMGWFVPFFSLLLVEPLIPGEYPQSVPAEAQRDPYIDGYMKASADQNQKCAVVGDVAISTVVVVTIAVIIGAAVAAADDDAN